MDAILEEYQPIIKNHVWNVVPRPRENLVVSSKWIFNTKHSIDASIEKYKVRFIARGFSQKEGIYYEDNFALVERYTLIKVVISLEAKMK